MSREESKLFRDILRYKKYPVKVVTDKMASFAKLSQTRVVSNKRFSRKVGIVSKSDFNRIKKSFIEYIS